MKKSIYIAVMAMVAVVWAGAALADTVDIGLGEMDRAEFETLRQMVNGEYRPSEVLTREKTKEVYVAEFNLRDVEEIRQAMAGDASRERETVAATDGLVDIGLGSMSTSEFCDLNKLVASNSNTSTTGFSHICP